MGGITDHRTSVLSCRAERNQLQVLPQRSGPRSISVLVAALGKTHAWRRTGSLCVQSCYDATVWHFDQVERAWFASDGPWQGHLGKGDLGVVRDVWTPSGSL